MVNLLNDASETPLFMRRDFLIIQFYLNIMANLMNIISPCHSCEPITDVTLTKFPKNQTNSIIFKQNLVALIKKYTNYCQLYTEDSKLAQYTSSAMIHGNTEITATLLSYFVILSAELCAIKLAISHITNMLPNDSIISDSLSALFPLKTIDPNTRTP